MTLVFNVTVPAATDDTARSVYIAGFLDRLDGGLPQWNPGGVVLTRVDATHWTITLTGKETTQIEYKYALGSWDHVEKDNTCGEVANRQLTLSYGADRNSDRQRHSAELAQRLALRQLEPVLSLAVEVPIANLGDRDF